MQTRLLLIRHGQTAWHAEHRIQGQLDIPLSPRGMVQASQLAGYLANEQLDAIYSSPQSRAWLTAAPLAATLGIEVIAEPSLRERAFGVFEGLTIDEIAARYPSPFRMWRERDPLWRPESGESGQQLIDRVLASIGRLTRRHTGGRIAVLSHGGVLDVVYRAARALPWQAPREHQMLNAAINRLIASPTGDDTVAMSIESWGEVAHLQPVPSEAATDSAAEVASSGLLA